MRYLLVKNKKLYKLFYKMELKYLRLKYVALNCFLPFYIRQEAFLGITKKKISYVNIKQRCFVTNKSRSVYNYFKISRIKLRGLMSAGTINGTKKNSW